VKQLSDDRVLAKYKIVHFATHGAVAGDVSATNEPGLILILTRPITPATPTTAI
jgi:CHAT domain-containing protein